MRIEETSALLAKVQAFDNRNVDEAVLSAWSEVLRPHTLRDCLAAVTSYYTTNTGWIMPAHVVDRVRAMEKRRIDEFRSGYHLNQVDADAALESGQWRETCQSLVRAIATGALTPEAYEAYQEDDRPLTAVLGRKELSQ